MAALGAPLATCIVALLPSLVHIQSSGGRQQPDCGCYANHSNALVFDTLPTGNACPGACLTSSALSVQGETSHDDKREYLVSLGLSSNKGAHSRPTPYHDKVTLYAGVVGYNGTGDIWSINPLLTQMPGSGEYNAQGIELDFNNLNAHRGDADGGTGLAPPVSYALSVTGAGNFRSSAAIGVMGQKEMWNRGIVFAADSVKQSTFQDLCSSQHKSIDIRGSPTYGIYQESSRSKNLFAGNTSVVGELRLVGGMVLVRDGKEHGAVLTEREELTNSGMVHLNQDGQTTVTFGAKLCGSDENAQPTHQHTYQLTAVGCPMPNLFVASEVAETEDGCAFSIAGGKPGAKVSWRVHSALASL